MQIARLLVLTLLVVAPALAQSQASVPLLAGETPAIETPAGETLGSEMLAMPMFPEAASEIAETYSPAPPAASASLPGAPTRQKVIDKKFIAVMGALGGAESLRFATHKLVLDHEFAAGAPWVTSVPPNQHLVAKYGGIYAAELLVAYEIKKPHGWLPGDRVIRKLWWAYPGTMLPIHIENGVLSIRTQPPACPVNECGPQ